MTNSENDAFGRVRSGFTGRKRARVAPSDGESAELEDELAQLRLFSTACLQPVVPAGTYGLQIDCEKRRLAVDV